MRVCLTVVFLISIFLLPFVQELSAADLCKDLPDHAALKAALKKVVVPGDAKANGGLAMNMWATLIGRDGTVCVVAFSGDSWRDQWLGSRAIAAQKANTANSFSLDSIAISTANLFFLVQPGNSLFGLQFSNPVATDVAYGGDSAMFGQANDPMTGKRVGGVNVFGGGLALYTKDGKMIGALGVSGDTSCADHNIAWKVRDALNLDYVPAGFSKKDAEDKGTDNIIYDIVDGKSASAFGHPDCGLGEKAISGQFTETHPTGRK